MIRTYAMPRRPRVAGLAFVSTLRRHLVGASPVVYGAFALCAVTPASAQSATAASALAASALAAADAPLGEIVVTAEHRKENVQTTPIAVSVYNGQALRTAGITNIQNLSAIAPDVSFTQTEGKPIITIRGISSRDTTEVGDPAITVSTDGFYLNRPYALDATLYDLDRVEVLRGPQGTLNGRNSVGGAVNIVTARPTDSFGGYASLAYGNYNDLEAQGAINIPLSDKVQIRGSFFSETHDGYRHNGIGGRTDDQDARSGRVQIAFQPTARLHGLITLEYDKLGGQGDGMQNIPFAFAPTGALIHDLPAGINSSYFLLKTLPYLDLREKQIRGNVGYDFDDFQVTVLGGYDDTQWHHSVDQSRANDDSNTYQFQENQFPKTSNAELRFTSKDSSRFQWQFGGFYFNENSHLVSADAYPLATGGFDESFGFVYKTQARSEAGYAQGSYQLTDTLKITGGYRYTHDFKSETGYYGNLTANVIYAYQDGRTSSSKSTFHAEIEDRLSTGNFVYAKFDTGYKAGGFNFGGSAYKPESITSYEVGSKNRFLNDQLQLNVAGYYSNYTNQQVANYTFLATGEPVQLTQNAGASHIYGVEGDLIYSIPQVAKLNLTANYLHARYADFLSIADPSDPTATGNVQLKGNRPPQSPSWSLAGGLERDWPLLGGTLTGRIQTKFQTASNFSFYNYADTRQGAFTMSDVFLTYRPADSWWSVTGYVKNLENSVVFSDAEESQYASAYSYEFYPPRTYGARLQYNW